MAKKTLGTGGGAGVDEVAVAATSFATAVEYRVIGHGAWTPSGKQLGLGVVFVPSEISMDAAQVAELVSSRMIEVVVCAVTKPYTQEVVTKSAIGGGDAS